MIAVITYNRRQYEDWARINRINLNKKDCPYVNIRSVEEAWGKELTDYIDMAYLNKRPWVMLGKVREEVRVRVRFNKLRAGQHDIITKEVHL